MNAIVNGKVVLPDRIVENAAVLYEDKIIEIVTSQEGMDRADYITDACGKYICPGLIDVHIHGYLGADASDGDAEGLRQMAQGLAKNGVTSFLPTTMTIPWDELEKAFDTARTVKEESEQPGWRGAQILGVHAEGPFINPAKKGAQAESAILHPDADRVLAHADIIRLMTVASEVDGGLEFAERILQESNITLSLGHTNATYDEALAGFDIGINHVTHTFNAMTPLHHRNPGVVGAALARDVYAELIADTFHVHPGLFLPVVKAKGDKLVLITDCLRSGGMPDGEYTLGGQAIFLKGIECRLADGTIAGSVLRLNDAVRNLREHTGISMAQAVACASINPARSIGADGEKGSLAAGKDADIILMDESCEVYMTVLRGNTIFERV